LDSTWKLNALHRTNLAAEKAAGASGAKGIFWECAGRPDRLLRGRRDRSPHQSAAQFLGYNEPEGAKGDELRYR
jgi:hypothetical protein